MMTPDDRKSLTKRTRSYVLLEDKVQEGRDDDKESHQEEDYLKQLR